MPVAGGRRKTAMRKLTVEERLIAALCFYERFRSQQQRKPYRASRTWPMFSRYGILHTAERLIMKPGRRSGFHRLKEAGLSEWTFEFIVVHNDHLFAPATVQCARERLAVA